MSKRYEEWPYAIIRKGPDYGKRIRIIKYNPGMRFPSNIRVIFEEDGKEYRYPRSSLRNDPHGKVKPQADPCK